LTPGIAAFIVATDTFQEPRLPGTLKDEIGKRGPFASPEEEAYLNLLRTTAMLGAGWDRLFKEHGLSESTYNILRILRGHAQDSGTANVGISCQTIGEQLISRLPDVTRLVDRLEKAGLVKRSRTPEDRRVVLVGITKKGLATLAALDEPVAALNRRQLAHLSRAELADVNRLLTKMRRPEGP
jgi:DNA-binding MarR family transcriptional regulator